MDDRTLRAFVAVASARRIDRAAEVLQYSAAAVSYQIRSLERELGQPVLERSEDGMRLTPFGSVILSAARRILAQVDLINELARRGPTEDPRDNVG